MTKQAINLIKRGTTVHVKVAYSGTALKDVLATELSNNFSIEYTDTLSELENYLNEQSLLSMPDVILLEADEDGECFQYIEKFNHNPLLHGLIIVLLSPHKNKAFKLRALKLKVHDYYTYPFPLEDLCERLGFLVKFKLIKPGLTDLSAQTDVGYDIPWSKRMFDIVFSGIALLCLTPFFLLVALLIRLESKGQVLYISKRVGAGYKIFDFYKFRSMRTDADKMLQDLSALNQYANAEENERGKSAFVKIQNDPRITKVGAFIRKTSIDELPQLYNVFIGNMSIVGNRPLPLYEAEMLTSNEWSMRFLGPAGLTGLWQISKRGKKEMSERERKRLDNYYATRYSFWLDMKIILGTIPALLQKEKV
ncbi:MAG: glycosyl transferase [Sphingobacteriaceae bacterium]|jgi:lipopolysaccharide/colanic/teichoic acid biosynthesis glycosyltransferase|nr:glycosyl transferase [Sphingobacteriaceae bacterium]